MLEHLVSYIGQYAREYFQQTGIECELNIPTQLPPCPLSSQLRHHLLLAVHEAFTNVLKHSGATQCKISIACDDRMLEIVVLDNGRGFAHPPNGASAMIGASGNGLHNMRQRLADIGGSCSVASDLRSGTRVHFLLPLDPVVMRKAAR